MLKTTLLLPLIFAMSNASELNYKFSYKITNGNNLITSEYFINDPKETHHILRGRDNAYLNYTCEKNDSSMQKTITNKILNADNTFTLLCQPVVDNSLSCTVKVYTVTEYDEKIRKAYDNSECINISPKQNEFKKTFSTISGEDGNLEIGNGYTISYKFININ